ncbi:T9SS type A sorting domain-containing protein [Gracilimonas mengyeensis]|nr:T9SS type A sorting domain-containing protein [Gracilimonas mengyeensis]
MALKLLSGTYAKFLHIALFVLVFQPITPVAAQTVLLPGDVAVVSVSADSQWVDFIPLLDIEKGTELYIGEGIWDDTAHTLKGQEILVRFDETVEAGSHLHIAKHNEQRISVTGDFSFKGDTHRIFIYQKENHKYRFITAAGWGAGPLWNNDEIDNASDLPESLQQKENTVLNLGSLPNYQYYLRNGASGTPRLIRKFVYDEANWRTRPDQPFTRFGTSFNMLKPPVILFENSVSTVKESDTTATLNVAIYGHDGSRLTVDVLFDSLRSTASYADFSTPDTLHQINFTGLIGDAVFEVHVPIVDDQVYEGTESAIYELGGLTQGNFGDFLTHSLIIRDNEVPEVEIISVQKLANGVEQVEIRNEEYYPISLQGWSFKVGKNRFYFNENIRLAANETLLWQSNSQPDHQPEEGARYFAAQLNEELLQAGKTLFLLDEYENIITRSQTVSMDLAQRNTAIDKISSGSTATPEHVAALTQSGLGTMEATTAEKQSRWQAIPLNRILKEQFPDKEFYYWNAIDKTFQEVNSDDVTGIGFSAIEPGEKRIFEGLQAKVPAESMELTAQMAAIDKDENGAIDGLEGLNLLYNNTSQTFTAADFLEGWKQDYPEIELDNNLYLVRNNAEGKLVYELLKAGDVISSEQAFWIQVNSPLELDTYSVRLLMREGELVTDQPRENAGIQFRFTAGAITQKVDLQLYEDEIPDIPRNLNMYEALLFSGHQDLDIAFGHTGEYYSKATISNTLNTQRSYPLWLRVPAEGTTVTLEIGKWEEIPEGWNITLLDQFTEKQYDLTKNFNLRFETGVHETVQGSDEEETSPVLVQRFMVTITPPEAEAEAANVNEELDVPREIELHQNYPNPFNPATAISFYLPETQWVRLSVFNIVGQPVAIITEGTLSAGEHQFEWNAADKPSGMYIYQLEVGNKVMTRKMTLVK